MVLKSGGRYLESPPGNLTLIGRDGVLGRGAGASACMGRLERNCPWTRGTRRGCVCNIPGTCTSRDLGGQRSFSQFKSVRNAWRVQCVQLCVDAMLALQRNFWPPRVHNPLLAPIVARTNHHFRYISSPPFSLSKRGPQPSTRSGTIQNNR